MNELKTKEDLLESLNELALLVQAKIEGLTAQSSIGLEDKLTKLEGKIQSLNEKNKKVAAILEKVMNELENLSSFEEIKCQQ
jgi:hypothetical protein